MSDEKPEAEKQGKRPSAKRGFAAIDPEKVREIASKGGKAAHAQGRAHQFQKGSEEAQRAGRLGAEAAKAKRLAEKAKAAAE